jgi:hypothetical protein
MGIIYDLWFLKVWGYAAFIWDGSLKTKFCLRILHWLVPHQRIDLNALMSQEHSDLSTRFLFL